MSAPRITFRIERDVTLSPQWFDLEWYDRSRTEGLSHEDALLEQVEIALMDDPIDLLWEAFGDFAEDFVSSIERIDLV